MTVSPYLRRAALLLLFSFVFSSCTARIASVPFDPGPESVASGVVYRLPKTRFKFASQLRVDQRLEVLRKFELESAKPELVKITVDGKSKNVDPRTLVLKAMEEARSAAQGSKDDLWGFTEKVLAAAERKFLEVTDGAPNRELRIEIRDTFRSIGPPKVHVRDSDSGLQGALLNGLARKSIGDPNMSFVVPTNKLNAFFVTTKEAGLTLHENGVLYKADATLTDDTAEILFDIGVGVANVMTTSILPGQLTGAAPSINESALRPPVALTPSKFILSVTVIDVVERDTDPPFELDPVTDFVNQEFDLAAHIGKRIEAKLKTRAPDQLIRDYRFRTRPAGKVELQDLDPPVLIDYQNANVPSIPTTPDLGGVANYKLLLHSERELSRLTSKELLALGRRRRNVSPPRRVTTLFGKNVDGIVTRVPASVDLHLVRKQGNDIELIHARSFLVAQGSVSVIPIKSTAFADRKINVELGPKGGGQGLGGITSYKHDSSGAGKRIASLFKSGSQQADKSLRTIQSAKESKLKNRQDADLAIQLIDQAIAARRLEIANLGDPENHANRDAILTKQAEIDKAALDVEAAENAIEAAKEAKAAADTAVPPVPADITKAAEQLRAAEFELNKQRINFALLERQLGDLRKPGAKDLAMIEELQKKIETLQFRRKQFEEQRDLGAAVTVPKASEL